MYTQSKYTLTNLGLATWCNLHCLDILLTLDTTSRWHKTHSRLSLTSLEYNEDTHNIIIISTGTHSMSVVCQGNVNTSGSYPRFLSLSVHVLCTCTCLVSWYHTEITNRIIAAHTLTNLEILCRRPASDDRRNIQTAQFKPNHSYYTHTENTNSQSYSHTDEFWQAADYGHNI